MAGQLTIDSLKTSSGVFATQNGMTGIAKAWVNFYGINPISVRDSFNISSVTRNSAGNYTVSFATAMPSGNYNFFGNVEGLTSPGATFIYAVNGTGTAPALKTTTQCRFATTSGTDAHDVCAMFIGS